MLRKYGGCTDAGMSPGAAAAHMVFSNTNLDLAYQGGVRVKGVEA